MRQALARQRHAALRARDAAVHGRRDGPRNVLRRPRGARHSDRRRDQVRRRLPGLLDALGDEDPVRDGHPEPVAERGLLPGQKVTVAHERDGRRLAANGFTLVPYDLPRGNLAGYFPELNPVVPMNRVARNSGTPIYKSVPVTILRYEEPQTAAPNSPPEP